MSTPSQIQSARANGALSHGPVTPEGKQKSSRNATRHGILSNTVVLEAEAKERFEELLESLTAELRPQNTTEAALVETMAVARWRWLRVLACQKMQFDIEMAREATVPSGPARAAIAFKKLSDNSRVLDVLLRYEVAFDRQYSRALNTLIKLRASANIFPSSEDAVTEAATATPAITEETEKTKFPNEFANCETNRTNCAPSRDETVRHAKPALGPLPNEHSLGIPESPYLSDFQKTVVSQYRPSGNNA